MSQRIPCRDSSFLMQNPSFLLQNPSFFNAKSIIFKCKIEYRLHRALESLQASIFSQHSTPLPAAPAAHHRHSRPRRCRFSIKWPLFSAKITQNAPVLGENVAKKRPFHMKYAASASACSSSCSSSNVIVACHANHHFSRAESTFFIGESSVFY